MKVLVVGSGGREHALCHALGRSARLSSLFCAPGNGGIGLIATLVPIAATDVGALTTWAVGNAVDLVVVGPEAPLAMGLADQLSAVGIKVFGPSAAAARIESSKGFMKDVLRDAGVPTADYGRFSDPEAAQEFIRRRGVPLVVKADGLAAGKGVVVCHTAEQALNAVKAMMVERTFGDAGGEVVIEDFLSGEEVSFFALSDGETAVPLAAAQDYKAVGDGDTGPNTGGMGACSPPPVFTATMADEVMKMSIQPVIDRMRQMGMPYKGVLFCGLMITDSGPKVLEYNARFGDPECQTLMARLDGDLLATMDAVACGHLDQVHLSWTDQAVVTVVMATKGYPASYRLGSEIKNISAAAAVEDVTILHAGTRIEDGHVFAHGGRVLNVVACGKSIEQARKQAYRAVDRLDWDGGFCRRDIGSRALARVPKAQ